MEDARGKKQITILKKKKKLSKSRNYVDLCAGGSDLASLAYVHGLALCVTIWSAYAFVALAGARVHWDAVTNKHE